MALSLKKRITSDSEYIARTWDYETAVKYIFDINNNILEAGFFTHYKNNRIIKRVIELPISYGCPINCKHCASGEINNISKLYDIDIINMCEYIMNDIGIKKEDTFLLTYSGIGEGALQREVIKSASIVLSKKYRNIYFNISTIGIDPLFIDFCKNLSHLINIKHLQVTYLHYDTKEITKIVPKAKELGFNFNNLLKKIPKTGISLSIRFNYILIKNYNDSLSHWNEFIKLILPYREFIIIRISKINQTEISLINKINSPDIKVLYDLESFLLSYNFNTHIFTPENIGNNMNCGQLLWNYTESKI